MAKNIYIYFLNLRLILRDSRPIRSNERLTLETSALKLFTVANLRYQLT